MEGGKSNAERDDRPGLISGAGLMKNREGVKRTMKCRGTESSVS